MRAQLERGGGVYKVVVRGNVADARPFIRSRPRLGSGKVAKEHEGFRATSISTLDSIS